MADANIAPAHPCPTCSKALRRIRGRNVFFWGCSDRECKTTLPDVKGKPGERKPPRPLSGFSCTACGKPLTRMRGMSKPKQKGQQLRPYDFYSCSGFPKCKTSINTGVDGTPAFADRKTSQKRTS